MNRTNVGGKKTVEANYCISVSPEGVIRPTKGMLARVDESDTVEAEYELGVCYANGDSENEVFEEVVWHLANIFLASKKGVELDEDKPGSDEVSEFIKESLRKYL